MGIIYFSTIDNRNARDIAIEGLEYSRPEKIDTYINI